MLRLRSGPDILVGAFAAPNPAAHPATFESPETAIRGRLARWREHTLSVFTKTPACPARPTKFNRLVSDTN